MPLLQAPGSGLSALPPLSLYIHIPWCIQKCPYCDFNSHRLKPDTDEAAYINALLTDLQHELPHVWGRLVDTIFIGGGTPSVFSAESIHRLLSGVRALVRLQPEAEITLYIDRLRPFDKAGAYGIQEWIGFVGVRGIEGSFYNVMGLPVGRLYEELRRMGEIVEGI